MSYQSMTVYHAKCDGCGCELNNEDAMLIVHETKEDLNEALLMNDWHIGETNPNMHWCDKCVENGVPIAAGEPEED